MHKPLATDYRPLLRHFSITDGLIRGTGLVNYVICTAAFVLLPGFGAHGLFISNAIQDTIAGLVEIPFGWVADRFGWAKAVIIAYTLKCFVPLLIVLAVYLAWIGKVELAWVALTCEAVLDAFVAALQNGAYEAAYSEWYRIRTGELTREPSEAPPPLFIRSLRYSMWIRVLIPVTIIGFIMLLQTIPSFRSIDVYTITFIALAFIFLLRLIGLARICLDLAPLIKSENDRIVRQQDMSKRMIIKASLRPIREHFAAFSLYTLACFQYGLSATYVAGTAMKEMSRLNLEPSHGWLASVGLSLSVYVFDSFFWLLCGYRIHKGNAALWIRNLGLTLLLTCLLTTSLHKIGRAHV